MAASTLSFGMLAPRAFWMARRRAGLVSGLGPPAFTAMAMSLLILVKTLAILFQRANMVALRVSKMRPMGGADTPQAPSCASAACDSIPAGRPPEDLQAPPAGLPRPLRPFHRPPRLAPGERVGARPREGPGDPEPEARGAPHLLPRLGQPRCGRCPGHDPLGRAGGAGEPPGRPGPRTRRAGVGPPNPVRRPGAGG